ncbi:MAG: hypothetical protein ABI325_04645 [Ginsengibacter sp.]
MIPKNLLRFVKKEFATMQISELLTRNVDVLNKVSIDQVKILKELKINNLYDLGLSDIFRNASYIRSIGNTALKPKDGLLPDEMIAAKSFSDSLDKLKFMEPALLTGVGDNLGKALTSAFGFKEIQDLATWPPFVGARLIVNYHLGVSPTSNSLTTNVDERNNVLINKPAIHSETEDPEAPRELVPSLGEYPTEVIYYDTVVMIDAPRTNKSEVKSLNGRVSLSFEDVKLGYDIPGFGAILSFKQSWFAEGITLGNLIKGVTLAPGQSTKIAVIDWQRTTTGNSAEDIAQSEALTNNMQEKRAVNEIADATAHELQTGSSNTGSVSTSFNEGVAAGGLAGGVLIGGTESGSLNRTAAFTNTKSEGDKTISSLMQQNIDNATQQNSFSSRNKRASIVTEQSQSESETITTTTITNYNHMHALTMEYWQVIQEFRTEVVIDKVKRCIFIPMEIIGFNDENIIKKFKTVLLKVARTERIKQLLRGIQRFVTVTQTAEEGDLVFLKNFPEGAANRERNVANRYSVIEKVKILKEFDTAMRTQVVQDFDYETRTWKMDAGKAIINVKWDITEHANLLSVRINTENGQTIEIKNNGGGFSNNSKNPDIPAEIPVSSIVSMEAKFTANTTAFLKQNLTLKIKSNGGGFNTLNLSFIVPKSAGQVTILEFEPPIGTSELGNLLSEDALFYSQQIWMNMDPHFLNLQLAPYTFKKGNGDEVRVTEFIDPKPVAMAGNCLGFIWHDTSDKNWVEWVSKNIDKVKSTQKVAIPTDGTFGEAVLGRFNSAEKLDMTRFWNWQDSPPPFTAPEIAAVQAGQHTVEGVQRAGNLDTPILNIQTPRQLPDPTGMQGVLQAITAANLFRDMTGVAQTSALAQSALNASSTGAIAAGSQAGANMATFANFQVEMAKIAASLAPMLLGFPPLPVPATSTISNAGAAMNAASALDNKQALAGLAQGGPSGSSLTSGAGARSSNEQKAIDKVLGTPPTISIPSIPGGPPNNERDSTVNISGSERAQIKAIKDNADTTPEGTPSDKELQQIIKLTKDDYNKNIRPFILSTSSDFVTLKPVLAQLLNWMADAESNGIGDEINEEKKEGFELAKQAMFTSLSNAVDRAKNNNDIKQVRLIMNISETALLMGFDDDLSAFSPDNILVNLNLGLIVSSSFDKTIKDGEEKPLRVNVLLKIDTNNGAPINGIATGVLVEGGAALPFNTGTTNEFGNFNCNIQCANRAALKITGMVDAGISGLSTEFEVEL